MADASGGFLHPVILIVGRVHPAGALEVRQRPLRFANDHRREGALEVVHREKEITSLALAAVGTGKAAAARLRGIAAVVESATSWISQGNERSSLANIMDMLSYLPYMQQLSHLSPIVNFIVKWMDEKSEEDDAIALQNFLNLFNPAFGPPGVFPPPQRVPQPAGI